MLKVSSSTSHPQPEPRENTTLTVNDVLASSTLTANDA